MTIKKVSISKKLSLFHDHWNPRIVGQLNGQQVKLVKTLGEFEWHFHKDEMFFVIKGELEMHLKDHILTIGEGEFIIIPRGTKHKPVALEEVHIMLFEPENTSNTGNVSNSERTRSNINWI